MIQRKIRGDDNSQHYLLNFFLIPVFFFFVCENMSSLLGWSGVHDVRGSRIEPKHDRTGMTDTVPNNEE